MLIIDAQVHIWGSGTPSSHHRQTSLYTADELIAEMEEAGVDGAVLHPPSWDLASNEMADEAVMAHPRALLHAGLVPAERSVATRPHRHLAAAAGDAGPAMVADPAGAGRTGRSTARWTGCGRRRRKPGCRSPPWPWRFLPQFRQIAERHPNLKLIVDHLGLVWGAKGQDAFAHLDDLLALAKFPNVAIKATGAPGYSAQAYPFRDLHDGLHRIYDAFGPDRFFWGTDITRMPCSYRQCVTMFTEELPWLKGHDLETVMGPGVIDWLGWKRP